MSISISIKTEGKSLIVSSPYNPDFVRWAKTRNGKFDKAQGTWTFDARDEAAVRERCIAVYGTDGSSDIELVDVRLIHVGGSNYAALCKGIFLLGRQVVRAFGRDSGAKLGEGCVLISGRIGSGGSVKNWTTVVSKGAVFEVRDVPRSALEDVDSSWKVEVIRPAPEIPIEKPEPPGMYIMIPSGELKELSDVVDLSETNHPLVRPGARLEACVAAEPPVALDLSFVSTEDLVAELRRRGIPNSIKAGE